MTTTRPLWLMHSLTAVSFLLLFSVPFAYADHGHRGGWGAGGGSRGAGGSGVRYRDSGGPGGFSGRSGYGSLGYRGGISGRSWSGGGYRGGYATYRYRSYWAPRYDYGVRYRYPVRYSYYYPRRFHSYFGPSFGISFVLTNFPAAGYYYYDPYCDESFDSLELYYDHFHSYHHPRVIEVISIDGGDPIGSYCWRGGEWVPY